MLGPAFQKDAKVTFSYTTSPCLNSAGVQPGAALVTCASRYIESWAAVLSASGPQDHLRRGRVASRELPERVLCHRKPLRASRRLSLLAFWGFYQSASYSQPKPIPDISKYNPERVNPTTKVIPRPKPHGNQAAETLPGDSGTSCP